MHSKDYINEFDEIPETDEEFNKILEEFIEDQKVIPFSESKMDVYDYLEMAAAQPTRTAALKIAKIALELAPRNVDARLAVIQLSAGSNEVLIKKLKKLIAEVDKKLHDDGWFDERYIGCFDGIHEVGPYMRVRSTYANALIDSSMFKMAIDECEYLLHLASNDHAGIRYRLMHIYALFEDEVSAIRLFNKFDEDSTMFLLPLSILYYKRGDYKNAENYLKALNQCNPDTLEFFSTLIGGGIADLIHDADLLSYTPFTIEEYRVELSENRFLFLSSSQYFHWAIKKLKKLK